MSISVFKYLVLLVVAIPFIGHSQFYNIANYGLDKGLSQSQILGMCKDHNGYLWIGTFGGGVNVFDGRDFAQFTKKDGLPNNNVWGIIQDTKGVIWLTTEKGVAQYDGNTFKVLSKKDGIGSDVVWNIMEDSKGQVWLGTDGSGACVYDGQSFKLLNKETGYQFSRINRIFEDSKGRYWFGTFEEGLAVGNGENFTYYKESTGFINDLVNDFWEDSNGRIWVATYSGIAVFEADLSSYRTITGIHNIGDYEVTRIFEDSYSNLWIGTFGGGVIYTSIDEDSPDLLGDGFTIKEAEGLGGNFVVDILEDRSGSIIMGLDGGGLSIYRGDVFRHYTKTHGLSSNVVMAVTVDKNGNVWAGFDGDGMSKIILNKKGHGFEVKHFGEESHTAGDIVNKLYTDSRGNVWAGNNNGLVKYDGKSFKKYTNEDGIPFEAIHCFLEDQKENMWVAGEGGLFKVSHGDLSDTNNIYFFEDEVVKDASVWDLKLDKSGIIWIATSDGLVKYVSGDFHLYTVKDGLKDNACTSLALDKLGRIWVGSEDGIAMFDGKEFVTYDEDQGLSSNNVYLLEFDNDHSLFIGTEKGLDRFVFDDDMKLLSIENYSSPEGFIGIECNSGAIATDKDGNLWIGTIKGLTRLDPKSIRSTAYHPEVNIKGVELFFGKEDLHDYAKEQSLWNHLPVNATLPFDKNHLTFNYIGVDFTYPGKTVYQIKLQGFDAKWQDVKSKTEITYSNLQAGDYVFKVRAIELGDDWHGAQTDEFSFRILAPYWQTWWFYTICALLAGAGIYAYTNFKTRQLKSQKIILEAEVKERTKEIEAQKEELQELSLVASKTDNYVVFLNGNYQITWVNDGFTRITGYEIGEVLSKTLNEVFFVGQTDPERIKRIQSNFGVIDSFSEELIIGTKENEVLWISMEISSIRDENGQIEKFIILGKNISERKQTEEFMKQKNRDITDSLIYAKQIQEAIMPKKEILHGLVNDSFVVYKPRDIVSGDFYWFTKIHDHLVIACADCTGHGVPGALISMIGNEFLHKVVNQAEITSPNLALTELDKEITRALHQKGGDTKSKDGMDIALCEINLKTLELHYSGAFRPIIVLRKDGLTLLTPDRFTIGGHEVKDKYFTSQRIQLEHGDSIYLFSDGVTDQFGGERGKKFLLKRFKKLILDIQDLSMPDQGDRIHDEFEKWRGQLEQIDDVCVLGVRV